MAPFPCSSEHTAASALLLLTVTPPPPQPSKGDGGDSLAERSELGKCAGADFGDQQSFVSGDSKSCCTSLPAGSSAESQARTIRMIALAALHRDVKLKAAQKKRLKIQSGVKFTSWKTCSGVKVAMTTSFSSASSESSCISTSSIAANSSARSRYYEPKAWGWRLASVGEQTSKIKKKKEKKKVGSARMRRIAEAILKLLSHGCYSEVQIRQALGDSPDTSKALRLLLRFAEVKRTGAGGRRSPYIYTIA